MKPVLFTVMLAMLMTACTSKNEPVSDPTIIESDTTIVVTDTTTTVVDSVTVQ